jgi:hypothetical protein
MELTPLGMLILVKLLQLENAPFPMDVTLLGIVMSDNSFCDEKAFAPILVTLAGIIVFFVPVRSVLEDVSINALQLSRES